MAKKFNIVMAVVVGILAVIYVGLDYLPENLQQNNKISSHSSAVPLRAIQDDTQKIAQAFANRKGDVQVQAKGEVAYILKDDNEGSRHQRFILKLSNGQTILVAHNIDLAPRIENLKKGDWVEFYGEYEYNPQGGVVHWTHHDPAGKHVHGWLKHQEKTYQ